MSKSNWVKCIWCGKEFDLSEYDALTQKEYSISHFCPDCQDSVFSTKCSKKKGDTMKEEEFDELVEKINRLCKEANTPFHMVIMVPKDDVDEYDDFGLHLMEQGSDISKIKIIRAFDAIYKGIIKNLNESESKDILGEILMSKGIFRPVIEEDDEENVAMVSLRNNLDERREELSKLLKTVKQNPEVEKIFNSLAMNGELNELIQKSKKTLDEIFNNLVNLDEGTGVEYHCNCPKCRKARESDENYECNCDFCKSMRKYKQKEKEERKQIKPEWDN